MWISISLEHDTASINTVLEPVERIGRPVSWCWSSRTLMATKRWALQSKGIGRNYHCQWERSLPVGIITTSENYHYQWEYYHYQWELSVPVRIITTSKNYHYQWELSLPVGIITTSGNYQYQWELSLPVRTITTSENYHYQ